MSFVTIIGRGHSGTRAISRTLRESGVFMGATLNDSGDLIPPHDIYAACRLMSRHVSYRGEGEWDFSKLHAMAIDPDFERLVASYLSSVLGSGEPRRGWKIPETTLIYPWIARLFPDNHFIYWIRDPRDCILGRHLTDDLGKFGVPCDPGTDLFERRALSWKYQAEIVKATPRPKHFLKVRFEDFVLRQEETLRRLERFLGFKLVRIAVRKDAVGRFRSASEDTDLAVFEEDLLEHDYK